MDITSVRSYPFANRPVIGGSWQCKYVGGQQEALCSDQQQQRKKPESRECSLRLYKSPIDCFLQTVKYTDGSIITGSLFTDTVVLTEKLVIENQDVTSATSIEPANHFRKENGILGSVCRSESPQILIHSALQSRPSGSDRKDTISEYDGASPHCYR